ncbi:MAG: GNAT family protein [Treponema sp.]|uniref:GNAT family N-acetyltransferase n=1 Tax=Treponema sp. TaxID=166 RepID=UPI002A90FFD8|nr:GNAT family protein [Treponema sp.]MDY6399007.1 GNAT family protein [Treponema sp.]
MKSVYEEVPVFENEKYLLRFVVNNDANDLLEVYSDKNAHPFFNSDNCHGDNFYYPTLERMNEAIHFWIDSYKNKWFVRWTIIQKQNNKAIGTIELFNREGNDSFNHAGVLRLDIKSDFEQSGIIEQILKEIIESAFKLFDTNKIITKIPMYAVERKDAFEKFGFKKSEDLLIGIDNFAYRDYWEKIK